MIFNITNVDQQLLPKDYIESSIPFLNFIFIILIYFDSPAYCKNSMDGKWYEFDDTQVEPLSEGALVTQDAYLLFYQRRSHASSSSEPGFSHWVYTIPGLKPLHCPDGMTLNYLAVRPMYSTVF